MTTLRALIPGILFAIALALFAVALGIKWPIVGAPIFAIAAGIVARRLIGANKMLEPGTAFAARPVLQTGIVLLGFGINLAVLWQAGRSSFPVLVGSLVVGLAGGLLLGRLMRIGFNMRMLIAAGTSVCGA